MGKGLLYVRFRVDASVEEEFNDWAQEEHIPERLSLPGFLAARRFVSTQGNRQYVVLYELANPSAVETPIYKHWAGEGRTAWTKRLSRYYRNEHLLRKVYAQVFERGECQPGGPENGGEIILCFVAGSEDSTEVASARLQNGLTGYMGGEARATGAQVFRDVALPGDFLVAVYPTGGETATLDDASGLLAALKESDPTLKFGECVTYREVFRKKSSLPNPADGF